MNRARLQWQCRRGLLELDLTFAAFLEHQYDSLSQVDQEEFGRLLKESDMMIWSWLQGAPAPKQYENLIFFLNSIIKD